MPNSIQSFIDLLANPRETLDVEIKEWLDIGTNKDHRAALAKEIIALANNGGGFVIIGFAESADGTFQPASSRPLDLNAWSQDKIQGIVARYIDPPIQCRTEHVSPPHLEVKFPLIVVPGGHGVPLRAKSGSPDGRTLAPNRVYVRRPGPCSEEPQSGAEWDKLFDQIVRNRRSELLDAMRSIIEGVLPTERGSHPTPGRLDVFIKDAAESWNTRIANLPIDAVPRFINGFYDCAFEIEGEFEHQSLAQLRDTIRSSVRNHTGWPAFTGTNNSAHPATPVSGAIEFWRGANEDGTYDVPHYHDFWRVSPDGLFFIRRGYPEDSEWKGMQPGRCFDIVTINKRLAETVMEVYYIAQALGAVGNIRCRFTLAGLAGRELVSNDNPNRSLSMSHRSAQNEYEASGVVAVDALPTSLPELVYSITAPLFELFDFYQLPKRLVEQEIANLLRHRY
tara:strand:+ start:284 stop:1633 length:1350 start_codon:yes stop_codon:yes gene_type:complete